MISGQNGKFNDARPGCHAIVLCGGEGRRMGGRKELLEFNGEPLLLRLCRSLSGIAERITVVADRKREYAFLPDGVRAIADEVADFGPIAGICAGMRVSDLPLQLVVACDYPLAGSFVWRALADTLARYPEADAVLPEAGGKLHPLCALYRQRTIGAWADAMASGNRRVMAATQRMRLVKWLPGDQAADRLMNMNTPDDYRLAKERLRP
ncbi:molybdenum cofactor guanylyltransferase [Cohnella rhizosphaerae]|uniref:Probable molybdenum cofactor guanylyltransferase n=2 Tax=Cohnella rhizosphaerae TaxID=1457232 RepID=A0A9X4KPB5_9BACL|nr:molybdenum cofactor guanylyltransferase [Cohnella rhizosphaerae]MDG0808277.1 molybdenum cofactor guanylyltransferase [Cohnella rhizosphaerae]